MKTSELVLIAVGAAVALAIIPLTAYGMGSWMPNNGSPGAGMGLGAGMMQGGPMGGGAGMGSGMMQGDMGGMMGGMQGGPMDGWANCPFHGDDARESDSLTVAIAGYRFQPQNLTVPVGTTVTWVNMDSVEHSVESGTHDAPADLFDSGLLGHMESFSYTFDRPGTYVYHCDPHPAMTGTIVVQ